MIAFLFVLFAAMPQAPAQSVPGPLPAAETSTPDAHVETQLERDTRQLASELRCPVCQGLSLQDSPSELSQEMRVIIREQLLAGRSVAEVKQYFVAKYGEWILLEPEPHGFNLTVYIAPVLLLLGGAAFLYFTARRWTRQQAASAAPPSD
ncbi:MAG: cytochrome c-type biogenesis protein CcmH [Gemmatimonadetes bacterium]|nr:cytochrome c-type biogenesis protein CcmH [Gemmatimonadota bacterium]